MFIKSGFIRWMKKSSVFQNRNRTTWSCQNYSQTWWTCSCLHGTQISRSHQKPPRPNSSCSTVPSAPWCNPGSADDLQTEDCGFPWLHCGTESWNKSLPFEPLRNFLPTLSAAEAGLTFALWSGLFVSSTGSLHVGLRLLSWDGDCLFLTWLLFLLDL